MRISDWSSDVCSSDLGAVLIARKVANVQRFQHPIAPLQRLARQRRGERARKHLREQGQDAHCEGRPTGAVAHDSFPSSWSPSSWDRSYSGRWPGGSRRTAGGSITNLPATWTTNGTAARLTGTMKLPPPARSIFTLHPATKTRPTPTRHTATTAP